MALKCCFLILHAESAYSKELNNVTVEIQNIFFVAAIIDVNNVPG
jgi:hypothetical protein